MHYLNYSNYVSSTHEIRFKLVSNCEQSMLYTKVCKFYIEKGCLCEQD